MKTNSTASDDIPRRKISDYRALSAVTQLGTRGILDKANAIGSDIWGTDEEFTLCGSKKLSKLLAPVPLQTLKLRHAALMVARHSGHRQVQCVAHLQSPKKGGLNFGSPSHCEV